MDYLNLVRKTSLTDIFSLICFLFAYKTFASNLDRILFIYPFRVDQAFLKISINSLCCTLSSTFETQVYVFLDFCYSFYHSKHDSNKTFSIVLKKDRSFISRLSNKRSVY